MNSLKDLAHLLSSCRSDPLRFVTLAFPWGKESLTAPTTWQQEVLQTLKDRMERGETTHLFAVASGHGVGKSALVAWLVLWALSTQEGTRGVVTANTLHQLKTKTWAEMSKWYHLFLFRSCFHLTSTSLTALGTHERTWRIDLIPWSERSTEAFAGLHNQGKRLLILFDEASSIPDSVFETTEGALTDEGTEIIWCVFGNPVRASGRFRDCFERHRHRWCCWTVDSRKVPLTNKKQIQNWIDDYGLDSHFVRSRVLGQFPDTDHDTFIPAPLVHQAMERQISEASHIPLILGVDVARFGPDRSAIVARRGRCIERILTYKKIDTVLFAHKVEEAISLLKPHVVYVDGGGVGAGVLDTLHHRPTLCPIVEVLFGARAQRPTIYANVRAELWGRLRHWLKQGALPQDDTLKQDLITPLYTFVHDTVLALESKRALRSRGRESPDIGDALALTFMYTKLSPPTIANTSFSVFNNKSMRFDI